MNWNAAIRNIADTNRRERARSLDGAGRPPREARYERLCAARDHAQSAHYALEEGEYSSALEYIAEAERALATARKLIEPEMRPTGGSEPPLAARKGNE